MGWEESQFGGLGPRKPKQPKQPKKRKNHGSVSTPSQNTYQPQQASYHENQAYSQQSAPQSTGTRHLDANLKPTPIPKILRGIGIAFLVLGCLMAIAALITGFTMNTYIGRWVIHYDFVFILVAIVCLLIGLIAMLPFFYYAKKLELLEEIRNALYKDRF